MNCKHRPSLTNNTLLIKISLHVSLWTTVISGAYRSFVCDCVKIVLYIHMRTCEGTCLLSLLLQTLHYIQSFPPSISCVQFIYNPYTPLYFCFSSLDDFLANRGTLSLLFMTSYFTFLQIKHKYFSINFSYLSAITWNISVKM